MKNDVWALLLAITVMGAGENFAALSDPFAWLSQVKKPALVVKNFEGLRFSIEDSTTHCSFETKSTLNCQINLKTKEGNVQAQAQMIFQKNLNGQRNSLGLIRWNRKMHWLKQYPSRNQYLEEDIKLGNLSARLQELVYFRFNNINWPVLIRAFDVVVNEGTSISVTTICDARYWPIIRETIDKIELSISKSAR